ncbi:uncharacterized protein LOC134527388 [Bacillus rossius redtenbacheri]|uniref:uncharacterized protein LOC134527388 n=1 Tax=Bacillus rossius redtenbacheri TaxID=93214 RepID=UPI002FDDBB3F
MATLAVEEADRQALHTISAKFTEEVLLEVLQKFAKRKDVCLSCYKVCSATSKGDNYLSSVWRISIEGASKPGDEKYSMSLIVKSLPPNIGRRKTFRSLDFFGNEVAFYEKVLSKFMAFQEKKKPKHPFIEIPGFYKALVDGENDFISLEDLAPAGYKSTSRLEGLDYAHTSMAMKILARFHALSFAIRDQEPDMFREMVDSLQEVYYKPALKPWYKNMLDKFVSLATDAMAQEMPGSVYEEKLRQLVAGEDFFDRICKLVADSREPHGVISHGDAWSSNFMFLYPGGDATSSPLAARMIDYQIVRCSSPVLDLSFFLYSCTGQELREKHYDGLMREYHTALSELIAELGSNPDRVYPFSAFQKELATYSKYGLYMALESLPMSLLSEEDAPDIDLIDGDDAVPLEQIWSLKPIKTQAGRLRICNMVKHLMQCGFV